MDDLKKMDGKKWKKLKKEFYGINTLVTTDYGLIDFDPERVKEIVGGENLSYDEYLEIERCSAPLCRRSFETCFYESIENLFKGQIEKISGGRICFKRIFVSGCYPDGICFDGKEDHVWMSAKGFEEFKVGDCVRFGADVYRYLKKSKGKLIDFALRDPWDIKKVGAYELPSDDDLLMQSIDSIICEVCLFNEHCHMGMCIANEEWRERMRKELFEAARNIEKKKGFG